jgi:hypothetical protein
VLVLQDVTLMRLFCIVLQGLRILEYACDYAAEHTLQSLSVWKLLEKEIAVSVALPLNLLAGHAMLYH